ncbi:MAG: hypothetical protein GX539_11805 [Candidatus Cloacimonetes bacterium]|nr:hypothetical protein [Candidatus Cloacimonadota bacterium]
MEASRPDRSGPALSFLLGRFHARGRVALIGLLCAACASSGSFAAGGPAPLIAQRLVEATTVGEPLHITFDWSLREREARYNGAGAARVQPPYRGRLDLFGPRGETYLIATIDHGRIDLPQGAERDALPPPALLWAALGVLYPPDGAQLTGTSTTGEGAEGQETQLEYRLGDERWRFRLVGDMLRSAEWQNGSDGRRTVELDGTISPGLPQRARYRDWIAFRELELNIRTAEPTEAFSDDVFRVPR